MKLGGEKVGILIWESPNPIENPFFLIVSVSFFRRSFSVTVTVESHGKQPLTFGLDMPFPSSFLSFGLEIASNHLYLFKFLKF